MRGFFIKKWKKLFLIGFLGFLFFLWFFLQITGFFALFEPPYEEGEYYKATPDMFGSFRLVVNKEESLIPSEIPIPTGQIVGITVKNDTNANHRIVFLKKKDENVKILHEYVLKPQEEALIYGFYFDVSKPDMPEKIRQEDTHSVMDKMFRLIYVAARCKPDEECFVSCASCYGGNVQSKVVLSE